MSIESGMLSNHLVLCRLLLLLPSVFPSTGIFSNESALHIRSQCPPHTKQKHLWGPSLRKRTHPGPSVLSYGKQTETPEPRQPTRAEAAARRRPAVPGSVPGPAIAASRPGRPLTLGVLAPGREQEVLDFLNFARLQDRAKAISR